MFKYVLIIILATLFIGLLLPQVVLAADCSKGLVPCGRDCNNNGKIDPEEKCGLCDIFVVLQRLLNGVGLVVAGWAVIFIVIGGIVIMAAGGSPDKASEGKKMISYAVIGIIVAFTAWIAINMIMNELVNPKVMPWPWNKIACVPGGGDDEEEEGEYCVCEVPVYDLDPSQYPDQAKNVATNVKTTKLASEEECGQKCNQSFLSSYCPTWQAEINASSYSFSCKTEEYVKNTAATGVNHPDFGNVTYCILGCFSTENECEECTNVEDPDFESCGRECFWMGKDYCLCKNIGAEACSGGKPWALTRIKKEIPCSGSLSNLTLWDCITSSECYCRLGGSPRFGDPCERCSPTSEGPSWCQRPAPAGSENWPIANIKPEQKGDASIDLTSFLNCFYSKTEVKNYPIVSISDDHLCDATCTIEETTCSSACQHACTSGHYGCGASSSCYGDSLAVDIDIADGDEIQEAAINKAAAECAEQLGWEMIRCLGPHNEPTHHNNHVHIGIAPAFTNCKCDNIKNIDEACILDLLGTDTHYECDGGGFCREVEGAGTNSCTLIDQYDSACTHKECVGYTCDEAPNAGQTDEPDQCVNNADCD